MKVLGLMFISIVSFTAFNQEDGAFEPLFNLSDTRWRSDYHCFSSDTVNEYILTTKEDLQWSWGNSIHFTDSTFSTDYTAPCGLDCFTSIIGSYKYLDTDQIEIYVETIDRNGFCQNSDTGTQIIRRSYGVYRIEQTENGLKLIKESDERGLSR